MRPAMGSNCSVRFSVILAVMAVVAFAMAYWLWPQDALVQRVLLPGGEAEQGPGDRDPGREGAEPQARQSIGGAASGPTMVRVLVVDADGAPVEGSAVRFGERRPLLAQADGLVEAELPPGRHWLAVEPPEGLALGAVRQRLTAVRNETVFVRVALTAPGLKQVWCRVVAEEDGAPLPGALALVHPYGDAEAETDADGLALVPLGASCDFLSVHCEGRSPRRVAPKASALDEDGALRIPLPKGADLDVVVMAGDQFAADCVVSVTMMPWTLSWPAAAGALGAAESVSATTGADGAASFADLPAGADVLVSVESPTGQGAAQRQSVALQPGANRLEVELSGLGRLGGRVLDPAGSPIPGARLMAVRCIADETIDWLADDALGESAYTESNGAFEIEGLEPGLWAVALQRAGEWASAVEVVEVPPGGVGKADLRATRALSIRGSLFGPGNRPISAFEVHARQQGVLVATAVTDHDGLFAIESLLPGDYEISTELYDQELAMRTPITVAAGRSGVELRVAAVTGGIRCRVVGAGALRDDVRVLARRRGGPETAGGRCDLDGRFEHLRVREGVWDIVATDGDGNVGAAHGVQVTAQQNAPEVEIVLLRSGLLRPSHPVATSFAVVRGDDVVVRGPLERGLPGEARVPEGAWTVEFLVRNRVVARRDVTIRRGEQVVVDGR